jgi:hypothetical protein
MARIEARIFTFLYRFFGFQEVEASTISRQSKQEGGKVFRPTHRPPLPPLPHPEISLVIINVRSRIEPTSIVRPEVSEKIPITPARIKHSEFRLIAHCLNQMSRRVFVLLLSDPGFTTLCVCICEVTMVPEQQPSTCNKKDAVLILNEK